MKQWLDLNPLNIDALALIGGVKADGYMHRSKDAGPLMIMNKMPISGLQLQLRAYMVLRAMRAITLDASTKRDFFVLKGCVSDCVYGTYIEQFSFS